MNQIMTIVSDPEFAVACITVATIGTVLLFIANYDRLARLVAKVRN